MDIKGVRLLPGFLVTRETDDTVATKSGLLTQENTDDFLVHGEIVISGTDKYKQGEHIIYHILDTESFRDGTDVYSLLPEEKVKGFYDIQ
jgi:hypothetical protein